MEKSKKLKIVESPEHVGAGLYTNSSFTMAYCAKPARDNTVKQITIFEACREGLTYRIFDNKSYNVPTSRLRCLIRIIVSSKEPDSSFKTFEKQINAGVKILNIMEERHGWLLTKMSDIEARKIGSEPRSSGMGRTVFAKMLTGSSKWMKSPHTLSLFFLLVRLGNKNSMFIGLKNYKELMEVCGQFSTRSSSDGYHIRKTCKFWDPLMADFNKMFKGLPLESNFRPGNYRTYYDEGITKLCNFKTTNPKIKSRFAALAKNANIEVPNK